MDAFLMIIFLETNNLKIGIGAGIGPVLLVILVIFVVLVYKIMKRGQYRNRFLLFFHSNLFSFFLLRFHVIFSSFFLFV